MVIGGHRVGTSLNDIHFADSNTGWIVGDDGTILKAANGGGSWAAQASSTTQHLNAVHFVDFNHGWAVGSLGTIVATADGGTTWVTQTSNISKELEDVLFIDSSTGGRLNHPQDQRRGWHLAPLPTRLC